MSTTDTLYQSRRTSIEQIEQGRDNVLRLRLYDQGTLTPPTGSPTCTVYDATNTAIATLTATVANGIASATLLAATTASAQRGMGWRVEWSFTAPDGTTRRERVEAALVTCRLLPPISAKDLFERVTSLDPDGPAPITRTPRAQFDNWIDEAWRKIEARLNRGGRRPWLVMSSADLREVHMLETLVLIFSDLASRLNPAHVESLRNYRSDLGTAWANTTFAYDSDDDGVADGGSVPRRASAQTSVWMSTSGTGPITGGWR